MSTVKIKNNRNILLELNIKLYPYISRICEFWAIPAFPVMFRQFRQNKHLQYLWQFRYLPKCLQELQKIPRSWIILSLNFTIFISQPFFQSSINFSFLYGSQNLCQTITGFHPLWFLFQVIRSHWTLKIHCFLYESSCY